MTACQDCGQDVRFVLLGLKPDGSNKWSPPLTLADRTVKERKTKGSEPFAHQGYTVTETFTIHDCTERQERMAEQLVRKQRAEQIAGRSEQAWVEALKRECPKCEIHAGHRCVNLTDVRLGRPRRDTRWPHAERLPPGWTEQQG